MKAYVYVSLKKSVLDPQGKTIHGSLKKMGYKGLEEVRQGKYFELTLAPDRHHSPELAICAALLDM
jgi:phosphoribosylformylglycinamidine synthase